MEAFSCTPLNEIVFNDGLLCIDVKSFDFTQIENISIPDSVCFIGEGAFSYNKKLKKVKLSNSIRIIQKECFSNCFSLKDVVIPPSVQVISDLAFTSKSLGTIKVPSSVCYIVSNILLHGEYNLKHTNYNYQYNLSSFKGILHDSISNNHFTHDNVFYPKLRGIKKSDYKLDPENGLLTIKEGVEFIPHSYFEGKRVSKIIFPSSLIAIGQSAFKSTFISSLELPPNLKYIGEYAFKNCRNLKDVKFNESLDYIDSFAFEETNVAYVDLPKHLKVIGWYAFDKMRVNLNPSEIICLSINSYTDYLPSIDSYSMFSKIYSHNMYTYSENNSKRFIGEEKKVVKIEPKQHNKKEVNAEVSNAYSKVIEMNIQNYIKDNKFLELESLKKIVEGLINEGCNLNYMCDDGEYLLFKLYKYGLQDLLLLFISYGTSLNVQDKDGQTLLMKCINDNKDLSLTIISYGCDVNVRDDNGDIALCYAIRKQDASLIKLLIEKGSYINIVNNNNESLIALAKKTKDEEIIKLIMFYCEESKNDEISDDMALIQKLLKK